MTKFGKRIIFLILLILGFSGYFLFFNNKNIESIESPVSETDTGFLYSEETDFYSIDMKYPKDALVAADAELFVFSKIEEFKNMFENFNDEDWEVFNNSTSGKYGLGVDYEKKDSGFGVVTYIFNTYEFTGGAHGNPGLSTFTYDSSGEKIAIEDVLKSDSQNIASLASMVQEKLSSSVEGGIESLFLEGLQPEYYNYKNFYFEGDNLVFLFPPYQAGPYVLGTLAVEVSVEELFGYMKKDYATSFYELNEEEFRGNVTWRGEVQSFSECDSDKEYLYHDTTGSLKDEYNQAKLSQDTHEKVPAILKGYIRSIPESEKGFAEEYDGIFVISELSQFGGGSIC
jgi:hypothetical protein